MNKIEALSVLEKYGSTHSRYGQVFTYSPDLYYDAQFNIKVRHPHFPDGTTTEQDKYINEAFFDILGWELEHLINNIEDDKYAPISIAQEGRQGGWLVCKWTQPENGWEAIRLAHAINRINKLVRATVEFVSSEAFWAEELEANCSVPVVEEVENWFPGSIS